MYSHRRKLGDASKQEKASRGCVDVGGGAGLAGESGEWWPAMMHHAGGIRHDSQTIIPTQRSNCKAQLRSFLPLQQLSSLGTPGRGKGGTAEGDQETTLEGPAGRSCCDAIVSRVGLDTD